MSSRKANLIKLKNLLQKLEKERLQKNISLSIDFNNLSSNPQQLSNIKAILDTYGIFFITNCLTTNDKKTLEQTIVKTHNQMFQDYNIVANNINEIPTKAQAGIMGNKTFGFLYKQPESTSDSLQTKITTNAPSKELVYFTHCPVYYDVNLEVLSQKPILAKTIIEITHPNATTKPIFSWDSAKVANFSKSNINSLTKSHIDWYDNLRQRYQIMLSVYEGRNKLFYCPHTLHQDVQKLIKEITGDKNIYVKYGFYPLPDDIIEVLKPFYLAPEEGSLAFWKSGIVHGEFVSEVKPYQKTTLKTIDQQLYHPDKKIEKPISNQLVFRMVVGTHLPIGLTDEAKKELAVLAKHGFIPHRYLHGNHKGIVDNKMHKGKTLYKRNRQPTQGEKQLFVNATKLIQNPITLQQELQQIPQNKLDLMSL